MMTRRALRGMATRQIPLQRDASSPSHTTMTKKMLRGPEQYDEIVHRLSPQALIMVLLSDAC